MQTILPKKINGLNRIDWIESLLKSLNEKNCKWGKYKCNCLLICSELSFFLIDCPRREKKQSWKEYKRVLIHRLNQIKVDITNPHRFIMQSKRTGKTFIWQFLRTGVFSSMCDGSKKKLSPTDTTIFKKMLKTRCTQNFSGGFIYKIQNKGELFK